MDKKKPEKKKLSKEEIEARAKAKAHKHRLQQLKEQDILSYPLNEEEDAELD